MINSNASKLVPLQAT